MKLIKKTNYEDTISLSAAELNNIRNYEEITVYNAKTGEIIAEKVDPQIIINSAFRPWIKNEKTGKARRAGYHVAKFK